MVWIRQKTEPGCGPKAGFAGRMRFKYDVIVHAISHRNGHVTVCGHGYDHRSAKWHMLGNGNMEVVTCLRCWTTPDPFP